MNTQLIQLYWDIGHDIVERTVRYAFSRAGSPVAVSTYTYDALPPEEQVALPGPADLTVQAPPTDGFTA